MAFDPELATRAWLATLSGPARARSDAYFEGGYLLLFVDAAITIAVTWATLRFGWAARLSAWAGRRRDGSARRPAVHALRFLPAYILLTTLLTLPWAIWEQFVREHDYGLSTQSFPAWAGEAAIAITINLVAVTLLFTGIHAAIRRAPRDWWLGATGITIAGLAFFILIAPVVVEPLFNRYTPLPAGPVRTAVLSMARANGIPAENVFVVDASRQTTRISANVAGLGATTRIALNDNLLKQPPDEIRAVMAHEMGHYVLGHVTKLLVALAILAALLFLFVARALPALLARFGAGWGVARLDDPAIFAPVTILLTIAFLALTPLFNTLIRTQEIEADRFGLNVARAPEAFASIAVKLGQYRKLEPGPWEEAVFYDHPSGRTRVLTAMRWKAEHLGQSDIR
ncbi:peptidase M48 [alpha proteobacterium AAP81b]|nr:peptidase M48 [alpha proteobacterium AAP81b]